MTIPKRLRDEVGIPPGSDVECGRDGDLITIKRAAQRTRPGKTRGERAVEALRGSVTRNRELSTDEIMSCCVAMTDTPVDTNVDLDVNGPVLISPETHP